MDLSHHVIVALDGTLHCADICYLVDTRELTPAQIEVMEGDDDTDRVDLAVALGVALENAILELPVNP
jgi:hypothetical protein